MTSPPGRTPHHPAAGGVALLGAKVFFILSGLVQQVLLGRLLGLGGYGALSTALSASSIAYNPLVQGSLQSMSRAVAQAEAASESTFRRLLGVHVQLAVVSGLCFSLLAPWLANALGAPHVTLSLQFLGAVLFLYAIYAPLIGALNGTRRLTLQAGFDVLSATLRTLGLAAGAYLGTAGLLPLGLGGPSGAALGFCISTFLVTALALGKVGIGAPGEGGPLLPAYRRQLVQLLGGQLLLNLLFQADALLLRRFAASAAMAAGLAPAAADPIVGAYRAAQLFSFLPFQLLASVTLVLFPMLARAQAAEPAQVSQMVRGGMRLSFLATVGMVSILTALAPGLVRLVFGAEAAALGAPILRILAPGMGFLALLGVLTTCLNSLGRERQTMTALGVALICVALLTTALSQSVPLGVALGTRVATGTGVALLLAVVQASRSLRSAVGPLLSLGTLLRGSAAGFLTVAAGLLVPPSPLATLAAGAVLTVLFVCFLIASRELQVSELRLRKTK